MTWQAITGIINFLPYLWVAYRSKACFTLGVFKNQGFYSSFSHTEVYVNQALVCSSKLYYAINMTTAFVCNLPKSLETYSGLIKYFKYYPYLFCICYDSRNGNLPVFYKFCTRRIAVVGEKSKAGWTSTKTEPNQTKAN